MKFYIYLFLIFSATFFLSCSNSKVVSSQEEVVIDDGYKTTPEGEVIFDDLSVAGNDESVSDPRPHSPEKTKIIADGLHITTMYDGYGNKTETRSFDDDALLRTIIVRTSGKGEKQVFVFAQNGTVRNLPVNMQNKAMTAPASEIAAAAGIYEEIKETPEPILVPDNPPTDSNFPVQKPPTKTAPAKTTQTENTESAPTESAKPSNENPVLPKQNAENLPTKNQSDEQN